MSQLAIPWPVVPTRYVTVHCRALESVDERTGKHFEWSYYLDEQRARSFAADINAGRQRDPFGKPWPPTIASVAS